MGRSAEQAGTGAYKKMGSPERTTHFNRMVGLGEVI